MSFNFFIILLGSILAGILGRMGGAGEPYKTWMRDWFIPVIFTGLMVWLTLKSLNLWLAGAYFIGFFALAGSLTTYWDKLWNYDNLWFSGFVTGISPIISSFILHNWIGLFIRAILLAIIWGCLNKYLPKKVLIWRKDIAEEFLRYFSLLITLPILL